MSINNPDAAALLAQMAQINRQLQALGINLVEEARRDMSKPAEDGGPRSNAHVFLKTLITPTVKVYLLNNEGTRINDRVVTISKESYDADPSRYERVTSRVRTVKASKPTLPDGVVFGSENKTTLMRTDTEVLFNMPEVQFIPGGVPNVKSDLVAAILRVREQFA